MFKFVSLLLLALPAVLSSSLDGPSTTILTGRSYTVDTPLGEVHGGWVNRTAKLELQAEKTSKTVKRDAPTGETNGERMARGALPAFPAAIERTVPNRMRKSIKRNPVLSPRQSGGFTPPPRPVQNEPTFLFPKENSDVDDRNIAVTLPFAMQVFDSSNTLVTVTTNGEIHLGEDDEDPYDNGALPAFTSTEENDYPDILSPYAVAAYWDDLWETNVVGSESGVTTELVALTGADAGQYEFTVRWRMIWIEEEDDQPVSVDVLLLYQTKYPGIFVVYYDLGAYRGNDPTLINPREYSGQSATVGAQGSEASGLFTQFEFDTLNSIPSGSIVVIDTNGSGTSTKYA